MPRHRTTALVATALTAATLAVGVPAFATTAGTLNGYVSGDSAFVISLKKSGVRVSTLRHGTYIVKVSDQGSTHNFHLVGPGVSKRTSVAGKGTTTWTVVLRPGTYTYVCDVHASMMKHTFKVT